MTSIKTRTYFKGNKMATIKARIYFVAPNGVTRKTKFFRNSECPCKSGKKYRHCCMPTHLKISGNTSFQFRYELT